MYLIKERFSSPVFWSGGYFIRWIVVRETVKWNLNSVTKFYEIVCTGVFAMTIYWSVHLGGCNTVGLYVM